MGWREFGVRNFLITGGEGLYFEVSYVFQMGKDRLNCSATAFSRWTKRIPFIAPDKTSPKQSSSFRHPRPALVPSPSWPPY